MPGEESSGSSEPPAATKRVRKPRTGNKMPTQRQVITEVDQITGYPSQPQKTASKCNSACGYLAREHIKITTEDWTEVPESVIEKIMGELWSKFEIPEGDQQKVERAAKVTMAKSHRNFRSTLNKEYVQKNRSPLQRYRQITERFGKISFE